MPCRAPRSGDGRCCGESVVSTHANRDPKGIELEGVQYLLVQRTARLRRRRSSDQIAQGRRRESHRVAIVADEAVHQEAIEHQRGRRLDSFEETERLHRDRSTASSGRLQNRSAVLVQLDQSCRQLSDSLVTGIVDRHVKGMPGFKREIKEIHEKRAKRKWMLSRPLKAYNGTYRNELQGTVVVTSTDGTLEVQAGNLHCVTTAYERPETARVELIPGDGQVIAFRPEKGDVKRISIGRKVYERVN